MTEKKRQSTVQPEPTQGFNSLAEDELNLIDLLKIIVRKKVFILAVTSIFTLFSIFFAQSITPIYRATVGFLQLDETPSSYFDTLEKFGPGLAETIKQRPVLRRFLFKIQAYEVKQEVFVNGGFQKKFFRETGIDTNQSVLAIYNSTKIFRDKGVYLRLEGYKPKVMLEFLTALVEAAKEKVNIELNDELRSVVEARINNLSNEIESLHQRITVQKQIEKERFSKAIAMINKHMGKKNNNSIRPGSEKFSLFWFLYEELSLQRKNLIRNYTVNLAMKELELKKLQTADLPLLKFKVVTIGKYGYSLTKPDQSWTIVGSGVAFGLFISTIMALLIHVGKP